MTHTLPRYNNIVLALASLTSRYWDERGMAWHVAVTGWLGNSTSRVFVRQAETCAWLWLLRGKGVDPMLVCNPLAAVESVTTGGANIMKIFNTKQPTWDLHCLWWLVAWANLNWTWRGVFQVLWIIAIFKYSLFYLGIILISPTRGAFWGWNNGIVEMQYL